MLLWRLFHNHDAASQDGGTAQPECRWLLAWSLVQADGVIISGVQVSALVSLGLKRTAGCDEVKDSDSSPPGLLLATRDGSLQSVVLDQICQAQLHAMSAVCWCPLCRQKVLCPLDDGCKWL